MQNKQKPHAQKQENLLNVGFYTAIILMTTYS